MSDYCTNCKWLTKQTNAGKTDWYCTCKAKPNSMIPPLTSLCGNPRRAIICEEQNWYKTKNKSEVHKLVTEHGRAMQFIVNKMLEQQEKKMTTEEQIKVMQAYMDGKQTQWSHRGKNDWKDNRATIEWNWFHFDYRIKPESKYRPLKPEELVELVGTVIIDLDGDQYVVGGSKWHDGEVFVFQSWVSSSYLLKNFKYKDGTPVGKLEE